MMMARGATFDPYDLIWLGEDDEAVRRVTADPSSAHAGCGGVFAAACTQGKRDLVIRLLDAGARVAPVVTACRSYLWSDPGLLRLLLDSGMDPDLPDWLHTTPLHNLCGRDGRGRPHPHRTECAAIFLEAGAKISPRDEDYRSTPLAWAARNGLPDMVEFLLVRGARRTCPTTSPGPPRWRGRPDVVMAKSPNFCASRRDGLSTISYQRAPTIRIPLTTEHTEITESRPETNPKAKMIAGDRVRPGWYPDGFSPCSPCSLWFNGPLYSRSSSPWFGRRTPSLQKAGPAPDPRPSIWRFGRHLDQPGHSW